MKILITGDWHLTDKTPRNRIDDYPSTQVRKIARIVGSAVNYRCPYILQPGDMFDSFRSPDILKSSYIEKFLNSKLNDNITILTVPGQHDMRYHNSDIRNTPMGVLISSKAINILGPTEPRILIDPGSRIIFYGSGWNEDIPEIKDFPDFIHIWVTHRMVIDEKLWEGQTDYEKGDLLLKRTKFDLIVTGDNHKSFYYKKDDRWLINCGSLMRSTIDQISHDPCIWMYDTETREAVKASLGATPIQEVMKIDEIEEEKEKNEQLLAFVEGLKEDTELEGVNFKKNLYSFINTNKVESEIKEMIEEILHGNFG